MIVFFMVICNLKLNRNTENYELPKIVNKELLFTQ